MNSGNDELRKKPNLYMPTQMGGLRHVPSANSLVGGPRTLDKKLSQGIPHLVGKSKEKENDRLINFERRGLKQLTEEYDDKTRKNSNALNFKTLNKFTSNGNAIVQKRKEKKEQRVQQKEIVRINEGISINFNIQNMIQTKKPEPKNESDRSTITNDDKDRRRERADKAQLRQPQNKKRQRASEFGLEEFQCEEVIDLQMKSTRLIPAAQQRAKFDTKETNILFKNMGNFMANPGLQFVRNEKNYQNEIKQFQNQQEIYHMSAQAQELSFLTNRQTAYSPDPYYIQKRQKNFTWNMRAKLVEWMMHLHSEYVLKRDTYHISVVLTDIFFTKSPNIQRGDLQLVGAAAMYIAAKLEQEQPLPVAKFAASTTGKYTTNAILEMQTKICKALKWQLNPPTIYMWANRIMLQWDTYLSENQYAKNHPLFRQKQHIYFKKPDEQSYTNFRQMMQLIDCSVADIQSFQYKPKLLACSFLYLVIGKEIGEFPVKKIATQFPSTSLYLLDEESIFNDLYRSFVDFTFAFTPFDLLPTVQYCATYFILTMNFQGPAIKQSIEDSKNMNIEEYTSYQTYNGHTLTAIRNRNRGV